MNWILIKDRIITLLFWAAIAFEVIAVWNLLEDMYYKGAKLLSRKDKRSIA
ncbi:MAG: hypothetical protein HN948_07220 [Clostridia bacterium]|jgi:hypothetical protein|nr:hypothetical protein [Clostridia bacterium]MBT7122784.1 hypothetical protein [Clostridia bacterium]